MDIIAKAPNGEIIYQYRAPRTLKGYARHILRGVGRWIEGLAERF